MSITVKDAAGATQTINTLPALGSAAASGSLPVAVATDHNLARASDITSLSAAITGVLTPTGGLPVALQGVAAVSQSGTWTVSLANGSTVALQGGNTVAIKVEGVVDLKTGAVVAAQQSGTWTVGLANGTTVALANGTQVAVASLPALPAGAAKIGSIDLANIDAVTGTEGAAPPTIPGTGIRGWLRAQFDRLEAIRALLAGTLTIGGTVTANLGTLSGAATAAKQDTGNTSLGSIDGKLPATLGQKTAALSLPVVLSSDGPLATAYGAAGDSATTDIAANGASFTFTSLFKGMVANLLTIRTSLAGTLAVGGNTSRPSAGFARPANTTAYVAGQLVANTTTAGSVTALALAAARKAGGTGAIPRLSLKKSTATLTAARFRVHLFRDAPVVAVGDGGTFAGNVSEAGYLGSFDVVMDRAWSDGALGLAVPNTGSAAVFAAAAGSQSIQALIEARDAYAPGSGETFTLTLDVAQD